MWRIFDALAPLYLDETGRIDPNKDIFPKPPLPHDFQEVPGLRLRLATPQDVALAAAALAQRGVFNEPEAHTRVLTTLHRKDAWPLVWEYKGIPLQFESIQIGSFGQIYIAHTVHFNRARPHWFWRECERPVWQWLRERGFTTARSLLIRANVRWLQDLKRLYSVREGSPTSRYIELVWDIQESLEKCTGWPERRTLGPDWRFRYGDYEYREMQPEEYGTVRGAVARMFHRLQRKDIVLNLYNLWWHLDRASVLLGYEKGKLRFVRIVRERRPDTASLALLNPIWRGHGHKITAYASTKWVHDLGYARVSTFVPKTQFEMPSTQFYFNMGHLKLWREVGNVEGEIMYELGLDTREFLRRSIQEWLNTPHHFPDTAYER